MRHLLLVGFFLLTTLLGRAQSPAPATPPLAASKAAVALDTVAALHNFYQHKRRALPRVLLMTGGAFALTILIHNMFADEPRNLSSALLPFSLGALSVPV